MCVVHEMERYCLQHADQLLWPGGDILRTYQRYYGPAALAPAIEIPDAFLRQPAKIRAASAPPEGTLRLLYLGRMERRKGVHILLHALLGLEGRTWELSLLGGDTDTGGLGGSMRDQLELMAAGEPRIKFMQPVPRSEVGQVIDAHDAVVVPSLWECWPNVAREAFLHGKPVIGTPVGGLTAMVRDGLSGWLAAEATAEALRAVLEPLVDNPELVRGLGRSGGPESVLSELTDEAAIRDEYLSLVEDNRPTQPFHSPTRTRARVPLVSFVLPYFKMHRFIEDTLESIATQTHSNIEIIIINDGSLLEADSVLEDLASQFDARLFTKPNGGLGSARNFGIAQANGRYVVPLDPDDMVDPVFVERCLAAVDTDPSLAYVGTWQRFVDEDLHPLPDADPGYTPLGNWSTLTRRQNVAGCPCALFPRSLFQSGWRYSLEVMTYEDWLLFMQLHLAGRFGAIVPEVLMTYRVRKSSMLRETEEPYRQRLEGEMRAVLANKEMQWALPRD